MFRLFLTPEWFNGLDLAFEAVGLVVALLIAGYSWRMYRVNNENRFAYFSLAFFLIAISLFFKLFVSGVLYFKPLRDIALDVLRPAAGEGLRFSDFFYRGTFFVQMASMLGGWLLIFFISQKERARLRRFYEVSQIALFVYLIVLISIAASLRYVLFYMTGLVILGLIVLNYYKNYLNNRNKNTFRVLSAFGSMFIGHIFFVFVFVHPILYAIGQLFLLAGFMLLLYTYHQVVKR